MRVTDMAANSFDHKCYDLAEAFLEDTPHLNTVTRRMALAALIQFTIDDRSLQDEEADRNQNHQRVGNEHLPDRRLAYRDKEVRRDEQNRVDGRKDQ